MRASTKVFVVVSGFPTNENKLCVVFGVAESESPSSVVTTIHSTSISIWCFSIVRALRIEYKWNLSAGTCKTCYP